MKPWKVKQIIAATPQKVSAPIRVDGAAAPGRRLNDDFRRGGLIPVESETTGGNWIVRIPQKTLAGRESLILQRGEPPACCAIVDQNQLPVCHSSFNSCELLIQVNWIIS